ncbi:stealth family protein [Weissella cibaria]|uniref:stealth family protein n=1 Tax=Weissella cibaria TaxID=137591 RepID=UPI00215A3691|nr:stealth family protein [Weissella cibaria]MCR8702365.1 stealth family protein [Weissella cibaria]
MAFNGKIDFVVPWVDGENKSWREKYEKYYAQIVDEDFNGEERFRSDFELLLLWIRGVKKYANWVNTIFIVVDRFTMNSLPKDLGQGVDLVCHDQFIPSQFLPTFNSNVIEIFSERIPELSEHFVLFNDDCYVVKPLGKEDFFSDRGVPIDSDFVSPLNSCIEYSHILLNNMILINKHFNYDYFKKMYLKKVLKNFDVRTLKSLFTTLTTGSFLGWNDEHMPIAYRKCDFKNTFKLCHKDRQSQGERRFRSRRDISHLLVRYWRLSNGEYERRRSNSLGVFLEIEENVYQPNLRNALESNSKIVCINDTNMANETSQKMYEGIKKILTTYYMRNIE